MKVVINRCYGGFGLSDAAYEKLIKLGMPVRVYIEEQKDPQTGRYIKVAENEGNIILDFGKRKSAITGRYHASWLQESEHRNNPLLVRVVEEMGAAANGQCADLNVIEIPDDIEWAIEEYDGIEWVAEKHRTWN